MTPFEFVFALISIVTSLALTQIITGVVAVVRHKDRSGISIAHALWMSIAFAVVIGNWGALWTARLDTEWPALRVIAWLASMTSLYAFCALVVPEIDRRSPLNLHEFHEREGRRYIIAHNVFALVALALTLIVNGITAYSTRFIVPAAIALLLGTVAMLTRGRAQLAATVPVAMLALLFMWVNINIVSSGAAQ